METINFCPIIRNSASVENSSAAIFRIEPLQIYAYLVSIISYMCMLFINDEKSV